MVERIARVRKEWAAADIDPAPGAEAPEWLLTAQAGHETTVSAATLRDAETYLGVATAHSVLDDDACDAMVEAIKLFDGLRALNEAGGTLKAACRGQGPPSGELLHFIAETLQDLENEDFPDERAA